MSTRRRTHKTPPPVVAIDRVREAGASALAWQQTDLLAYTDPNGRWLRLGQRLDVLTAWVVPLVVLAALLARGADLAMIAGVFIMGVALIRNGLVRVPAWALALTITIEALVLPHAVSTGYVLSVGVMVWGAWLAVLRGQRDVVWSCIAVVASLAVVVVPRVSSVLALLFVAVWLLAGLGVDWALCGVPLWQRRWSVGLSVDGLRLSAMTFQAPWLTRVVALNERRQAEHPDLARKRAGAWGELRTALTLLGLKRGSGAVMVHDVLIPGARDANADHVVVARSGWYGLDSKQYGTRQDPGIVFYDRQREALVHRSTRGVRDVTGSVNTLVWACQAIGATLSEASRHGGVVGLLVIWGASVEPGTVAFSRDGTAVEVIAGPDLVARIEGTPNLLSRGDLVKARLALRGLRAATHGAEPQVVTPMGRRLRRSLAWNAPVVAGMRRQAPAAEVVTRSSVPDAPVAARDERQTIGGTQDAVPVTAPIPVSQSGDVSDSSSFAEQVRVLDDDAVEVAERWAQMLDAPSAAPDDVRELAGVKRGDVLTHFILGDVDDGVQVEDVVAMREPCAGGQGGPYVWVCSMEAWTTHFQSGREVLVVPVSAGSVLRRES